MWQTNVKYLFERQIRMRFFRIWCKNHLTIKSPRLFQPSWKMTSYLKCKHNSNCIECLEGESFFNCQWYISHFEIWYKWSWPRAKSINKTKWELALLSLYKFGEFFVCREIRRIENVDIFSFIHCGKEYNLYELIDEVIDHLNCSSK